MAAVRPSVGRGRPPVIDGEAVRVAASEVSVDFAIGARIFHQKFGYGRVQAVNGDRLDIDFDKAGRKTVIHSFVEPAPG